MNKIDKKTKPKVKKEPKSCARYNNTEILHLLEQLRQNFQQALDNTVTRIVTGVVEVEKRIEAIENKLAKFKEETRGDQSRMSAEIKEWLGRLQLNNLKLEGLKCIGSTVDKLEERVAEFESRLGTQEAKEKGQLPFNIVIVK